MVLSKERPKSKEKSHVHKKGKTCPVVKLLPKNLQEQVEISPHLMDYIHDLPIETIGIPEFHEVLTGKSGDMKNPNIIYPIGGGLYIHILPDPTDARNFYYAIEPGMSVDSVEIMNMLESNLVDYVEELDDLSGGETIDRTKALLGVLDQICVIVKPGQLQAAREKLAKKDDGTVPVTRVQYETLKYELIRDKEGLGVLQPLVLDPYLEDISCSGIGPIFLEHKVFKALKSNIIFKDYRELDDFVIQLSERIGKPVTYRQPIIDSVLPDGSRINLVFGEDVSLRGSNFTIRKFSETPISIVQLVEFGGLTYEMAAYLSLAMHHGLNIFVSGETASGKTTLMNAMTTFLPATDKIVSIEDTPEVQIPHPNWCREVVRASTGESGASVGMFDLLRAALRQRPNEIIIGEIRGAEGAIAFQAMQTGHACMATFHADSVEKLIQRLTGSPISIPKTYVDNLNLVVIQSMVRLPNGKPGRRLISLNEIVGYDPPSDSFSYVEVFRWDPAKDEFEFTGYMNSYMLEEVIAPKRGLPPSRKREIYDELNRRTNLLRRLKDQGVTGFHEIFAVLAQANKEGIFK
ncbi:MAG: type II/IV secretion system ATPase subunit [SAR202 cluster bacterium]|nr:type II/IV secretion system ATPase subunit [SAR202 cluster bacterium]